MRHLPFVIVAAGLVLGAVIRLRRRSAGQPSPLARLLGRVDWRAFLGDTGLVAAREVSERIRGRLFRVATLLMLLAVGAAIIIPKIDQGSSGPEKVGVVGTLSPSLRATVVSSAKGVGATRTVFLNEADLAAAKTAVRSGKIDLAVVDGDEIVVQKLPSETDASTTAQVVRATATALGIETAFRSAALTPTQEAQLSRARAVPILALKTATPATKGPKLVTGIYGIILIFVMLQQYDTWTLMGVMEEKSSRVVEVLLAAVRPIQLLTGKVLGIGVVALAQASLIVGFALILAKAVGSTLVQGTAPLVVVTALVWLVLGYAFYCWVFAAAGSMAERSDQVQSLAIPISIPLIFGYIVSITAISSSSPSALVHVLAYLPPTAPFAMTVLVALGLATWWQFAVSAAISVAGTVVVARLAAGIYRRAVLRTGRRVPLRELFSAGSAPAGRT